MRNSKNLESTLAVWQSIRRTLRDDNSNEESLGTPDSCSLEFQFSLGSSDLGMSVLISTHPHFKQARDFPLFHALVGRSGGVGKGDPVTPFADV